MSIHFIILIIVKHNNFGIENPRIFNTDPRVKKGNVLFKHHRSRIKSKKFSLEKIKDDPNAKS